ncbi:MAG: deoxyguanosinetriphosphate triphosphohydrolase [Rickettsiales bacterium]|nr:deoxyguanosinetriphosphate triphosphohydrolase [Rickettsiales bacterium]
MIDFELARFAVDENKSRGRRYGELYDDSKYRSVFGRDRDRIINSSAFRRLQYKTQVFVNHEGDHYRTRLTHSLEVAQIARWISSGLRVNKDLAEIISLAHDLGHSPFGHAGEDALNEKLKEIGMGFEFSHNAHALKIITKLENRFIEFEGLNLSWEMLEGVVKHNGPLIGEVDSYILQYNAQFDLDLRNYSSIEAQISAISDDIAYNNHDLEDGLRAGLFEVEDLLELKVVGDIYREILSNYPNLRREMLVGEAKKRLTLAMVINVIENTQQNIVDEKIEVVDDVRKSSKSLVCFSKKMEEAHQGLKAFLMANMYRHKRVNEMTKDAKKVVGDLFDFYLKDPTLIPKEIHHKFCIKDDKSLVILICDYIAGMTDRFAINQFKNLNV